MPFDFKPSEKKPQDYGGSPFKALMAEVKEFGAQRRQHNMKRYMGLEKDEEPIASPMGDMEAPAEPMSREECEACKAGECDDPEHMGEEEKGKMLAILLPGGE
jgi:hypothetical protein